MSNLWIQFLIGESVVAVWVVIFTMVTFVLWMYKHWKR